MKLLLDDKATRGCNLNANEACIFAAILKCTRAGRGWYGNYRELAAAMPFVMSRQTASRAVDKLLTLGLIEVRENETLWATITEQTSVQNGRQTVQNGRQTVQIGLPPNNPPIKNNMNEKEREQQRALCARDCEEQQDSQFLEEDFNAFWMLFDPKPEFANRKKATWDVWKTRTPVARKRILEAAQEGAPGHPGDNPNPYFFVADFPEPQPHFLSGVEQDNCHVACIPLVQVKYNGKFLICTRATMELFGLEWVRDW